MVHQRYQNDSLFSDTVHKMIPLYKYFQKMLKSITNGSPAHSVGGQTCNCRWRLSSSVVCHPPSSVTLA